MSFPNMFCAIILCFQHEQLEVRRLRSDVYINTDFINTKAESAKYIDGNREEKKKKNGKGIMQITCVATATDSSRGHFMSLTLWDKDECVCQIVR